MADDLSHHHGPLTDRFGDTPLTQLSDDEADSFEHNGFLGGVRLLSDPQLEALRAELADLMRPDHDGRELWYERHDNESSDEGTALFHALGAWRLRPAMHDLLWSPTFVAAAERLLGGPVRFWHDQLFCKPAHHGGVVAWHQDYSYWTRTIPMQHLTCWIALDDSTVENGCVQIIRGSHHRLINGEEEAGFLDEAQMAEHCPEDKVEFLELEAGEVVLLHNWTLHRSDVNRSDRPRRAFSVCMMDAATCWSGSGEPAGFPVIFGGAMA